MADWTASMKQTFEYYIVDPNSWKDTKLLDNVKTCTINRDSEAETLGSATIDVTESVGEAYIRVYLVTIQNGIKERHPLGTFMVQTPLSSFDGKIRSVTMDAYTPLIELKENKPTLGYSRLKTENIMDVAYELTREHARAPVIKANNDELLTFDFISSTEDTWISFISDLISNAKYIFALDEMGRILFAPKQETASLQPIWTFNDDNSSILLPEVTMDHDLYGIPNVVEVIYSGEYDTYYAKVVNDNVNSPTSIYSRGREIVHRVTNPDFGGEPTQAMIQEHAELLLRELSTVEYSVSFSHGYCPVRLGDCVRLNYTNAGINDIKAKVVSQSIKCEAGCTVKTKAVYTTTLWKPLSYKVVYNANGGTGAPHTQTKVKDEVLTLSYVKPTLDGSTFLGWSTSPYSTEVTYEAGDTYSINADITLYAVWG